MTQPPSSPATIGTQPRTADEVNTLIGTHLRSFSTNKVLIHQDHAWFGVTDLKVAPYFFTEAQEATLKSAIADLDTALAAIDMTFISQIVGI